MKNKNLKLILAGQAVSLFGSAIQRVALSLYILELTGNATLFANILAFSTLPYILFAPLAGIIADRVNRKKIMVVLDGFSGILLVLFGGILSSGNHLVPSVCITMFLLSAITCMYNPAVVSSIPQVAGKEELVRANGLVSQIGASANFIGPVLAGVLYSVLGVCGIVWLNAVSFFISAGMECFIQIPDVSKAAKRQNGKSEIKETFLFLQKEKKAVAGIIASYGLLNICLVPVTTVLFPYMVNTDWQLGTKVYGIMEAFLVAGMIAGGMFVTKNPKRVPILSVHKWNYPMCFALFCMGGGLVLCSENLTGRMLLFMAGIWTLCGSLIMLCLGVGNIVTAAYIQSQIPGERLGKVSAISTAAATAAIPIGQMLLGFIMSYSVKISTILIVMSGLNLLVALFVRWNILNHVEKKPEF